MAKKSILSINTRVTLILLLQAPIGLAAVLLQAKKLTHSTEGFAVATYFSMLIFYGINACVAQADYKRIPSKNNFKTILPYAVSFIGQIFCIASYMSTHIKEYKKHHAAHFFTNEDMLIFSFLGIASILWLVAWKREKISLRDPLFGGYVSGTFVAIPQVFYAITIFSNGIGGVSGLAVLLWLFPGMLRIRQIRLASRGHALDKKQRAIVFSDKLNVWSWLSVVLVSIYIWVQHFTPTAAWLKSFL